MPSGTAVFLDTSIQIARRVHHTATRQRIENRLKAFNFVTTSLVVRREFKRRLIKDCVYLLKLFQHYDGSFHEVRRRLERLPAAQNRKFRICLQIVQTIDEETDLDRDRGARSQYLLNFMIKHGLRRMEKGCHVLQDSGCAYGKRDVRIKKETFDFGPEKCTAYADCGIIAFLNANRHSLGRILDHLQSIPAGNTPGNKSTELVRAEEFIEKFLSDPNSVRELNPCRSVADLIIAIESGLIPTFYTLNGKESQHLCRPLQKELIVLPLNPMSEEIVCEPMAASWPRF